MELAICLARFSLLRCATYVHSIFVDKLGSDAGCRWPTSRKWASTSVTLWARCREEGRPGIKLHDCMSHGQQWPVAVCASPWSGLVSCSVGPVVNCGGQHACALKLLLVNRAVITHYALRTLVSIQLYQTCLETQTKESNMCTSLGDQNLLPQWK